MLHTDITPRAAADIREAVRYYAQKASPEVAARFRDEFRTACAVLAERPGLGSLRFAHLLEGVELRTWWLNRFPFRLFYVVEGDTLHVLAVEHERRNLAPVPLPRKRKPD